MATQVNIFADQGSDYTLDLSVKEDNGSNTNLTTYTTTAKFAKNYGSSQTYSFTVETVSAADGTLKIKLPAETSANVASGKYEYDVKIDSTSLDITRRVIEGILTIRPKVS